MDEAVDAFVGSGAREPAGGVAPAAEHKSLHEVEDHLFEERGSAVGDFVEQLGGEFVVEGFVGPFEDGLGRFGGRVLPPPPTSVSRCGEVSRSGRVCRCLLPKYVGVLWEAVDRTRKKTEKLTPFGDLESLPDIELPLCRRRGGGVIRPGILEVDPIGSGNRRW